MPPTPDPQTPRTRRADEPGSGRRSRQPGASQHRRVGAHRGQAPKTSGLKLFVIATIATVVLTGAGISAFLLLSKQQAPEPTRTVMAAPPTAEAIDPAYTALVLDGAGNLPAARRVSVKLIAAGMPEEQVSVTAAATSDFETTTVYYANEADEATARAVAAVIGAGAVAQSDAYFSPDPDAKELAVVVGADLAS